MSKRRRQRKQLAWAVVAAALLAAGLGVYASEDHTAAPTGPVCVATVGSTTVGLTREQMRNAATIAAVGIKVGMPNHAVTIALATVMQESQIRNLDYGDRDSLGLFQQRPSQGWGTAAQVQDPVYASTIFYSRLNKLKNWQTMSVNDAAQAVQNSGYPYAYDQWEDKARILAQVLTGEAPAGLTCRGAVTPQVPPPTSLAKQLKDEAGDPGVGATVTAARGWVLASWLVAHSEDYGVAAVSFRGLRWTAKTNSWVPDRSAGMTVEVNPS